MMQLPRQDEKVILSMYDQTGNDVPGYRMTLESYTAGRWRIYSEDLQDEVIIKCPVKRKTTYRSKNGKIAVTVKRYGLMDITISADYDLIK
jgi:hypothetical protein